MDKPKTIVLITKDIALAGIIDKLLDDAYTVVPFTSIQSSFDYIYSATPDMLVIDIDGDHPSTISVLNEIKADPLFGHLPAMALFDDDFPFPQWDHLYIEDYLRKASLEDEIRPKIDLCMHRAERIVEINPLTRLPGNIAINKQLQKRLDSGDVFALAYADLDYFKPYNDKYGFSRGDEVLKMLGRLILNSVKEQQPHGSFVGHIGGDDFIFVMDVGLIEPAAAKIADYFDRIIPTFYDADDRTKGHIESVDREGKKRVFPIMGLSIGVAYNKIKKYTHYGEIAEVASEMKKYAKSIGGSCYRIDKRYHQPAN